MTIVAGNVVTGEMVEELILSGADVVKVRRRLWGMRNRWVWRLGGWAGGGSMKEVS